MLLKRTSDVEDSPALVKLYKNYLRNDEEGLQEEVERLRKKEENATIKLLESQTKWTNFAKDILAVCKELLKAIHTLQANNPVPLDFLEMSEVRIKKYEVFLNESEATFSSNDNHISPEQNQGLSSLQNVKIGTPIPFLNYTNVKPFLRTNCLENKKKGWC